MVRTAIVVVASMHLAACSYLPAQQEKARTQQILSSIDGVLLATVECGSAMFAGDQICAEVVMKDGARLRFSKLGFNSFGATAVNVFVDEAGGLMPRVASCSSVGAPNLHRLTALGHHFHPTLIDVKDAVTRHKEVMQEVQWWPQCPQYFEVQDSHGANFRYCSRAKSAADEPPRPERCPGE